MQGNIFSTIALEVCERLMGAPDQAGATDLRWGRRGSFRLLLQSGSWHDYENGERGGVLDLIQRELRIDKESSIQWLRSEGLLPNDGGDRGNEPPPPKRRRALFLGGGGDQIHQAGLKSRPWGGSGAK